MSGQNPSWFDSGFQIPSVWSFSWGFQYQVTKSSTIEASYVGSRSYNLNMNRDYNIPSLDVRKTCNYLEGGSAAFCNQQVPNPFKGIPAFNGTSYYTANTISYYQMQLPFPQFSGTLQQYGKNNSWIKYNSLQVNYNLRMRGGLNIAGNYTLAKQIEQWGYMDVFTNTPQQSPYFLDKPQVLKITAIWDLPFGEGKKFGAGSQRYRQARDFRMGIHDVLQRQLRGIPGQPPQQRIHAEGCGQGFRRHLQRRCGLEGLSGPRMEPLRTCGRT